jgi:hypothetical protein
MGDGHVLYRLYLPFSLCANADDGYRCQGRCAGTGCAAVSQAVKFGRFVVLQRGLKVKDNIKLVCKFSFIYPHLIWRWWTLLSHSDKASMVWVQKGGRQSSALIG